MGAQSRPRGDPDVRGATVGLGLGLVALGVEGVRRTERVGDGPRPRSTASGPPTGNTRCATPLHRRDRHLPRGLCW
jgi:hypothetical protein